VIPPPSLREDLPTGRQAPPKLGGDKYIIMSPKVFIIITTWNSERFLSDLFLSLQKIDYPKSDWSLVVVDNGSKDKTLEILRSWQVKMLNFSTVIENKENKGFVVGYNQGIEYALKNKTDYIVVMNDDIILEADWLNKMIEVMEKDKSIGITQPMITKYPEKNKINSFGNSYHFLGFGFSQGGEMTMKNYFAKNRNANYEPAYISLATAVMRGETLRKIGLLDPNYFTYHEDTDISFRARLYGWKLLVVVNSIVHHNYTFPAKKNKRRYFWLEKNRIYLMLKFFKLKTLLLILPAGLVMEIGLILFSIARGFAWQRLKAHGWILFNLPKILKVRREVQKNRQFGDDKLYEFMTGKIEFQEIDNLLLKYIGNPILNLYFKFIKKFI